MVLNFNRSKEHRESFGSPNMLNKNEKINPRIAKRTQEKSFSIAWLFVIQQTAYYAV